METYYTLSVVIFLAIVLALVVLLLQAVSRALSRLGTFRGILFFLPASGLLAWLALLAFLAQSGFFMNFMALPPRIAFAVLPPVLVILFVAGSAKLTRLLAVLPPTWLIGAQVFRVAMELVLWLLFRDNLVPVQMTFEGLNYDVLTGLTAPFAALYLARNPGRRKTPGVVWNILGLLLLFNIVMIALLSTPSPFRLFMNEPANTIVARWPFIWLPGFVVPMAFLLHVFSLKQLLAKPGSGAAAAPGKAIVI
jgi:hypothetical protein